MLHYHTSLILIRYSPSRLLSSLLNYKTFTSRFKVVSCLLCLTCATLPSPFPHVRANSWLTFVLFLSTCRYLTDQFLHFLTILQMKNLSPTRSVLASSHGTGVATLRTGLDPDSRSRAATGKLPGGRGGPDAVLDELSCGAARFPRPSLHRKGVLVKVLNLIFKTFFLL